MAKTKTWDDPKLYRELSEPKASADELNNEVQLFFDGVKALREKHKIRDAYLCIRSPYLTPNGEEVDGFCRLGMGDEFQGEALLAFALGQVQGERQEYIGSLMKRAVKATR